MTEYNILAKLQIDTTNVDAKLKSYNPTINVKAKIQDADAMNITMGKMQNQLDAIKIKNADAFKNKDVIAMGNSVQSLINGYDGTRKAAGEISVAMGSLRNKVLETNNAIRLTTSSSDNFITSIGKVIPKIALWAIATTLLYGALHQLQGGVQYIENLNQAMTDIGMVTGETTYQLRGMATEFNTMAKQLGVDALAVAEGATEFIRQGKSAAETTMMLETSTKMSKIGNLEAADATDKLIAVTNAYNIAAKDSIKVVDVLTNLDNKFATSTAELSAAMQKSSSMAKQAGVSYQDLASYIKYSVLI